MHDSAEVEQFDGAVVNELRTTYQRIKPPAAAERLWNRVFTRSDRQQLGENLETAYREHGTVGMYMAVRHVAFPRAVVEVAEQLGFLDQPTAEWLLREVGDERPQPDRPFWDASAGELRVGDQVVRRIRVMNRPTNLQRIVDAFQAARWPRRIDNPLTLGQQQLHEALRSLNRELHLIKFHSQEGGTAITWDWR